MNMRKNEEISKTQEKMKERLNELKKKEEEIENRIQQKKEIQLKIKQTIRGIPSMDEQEVVKMAKICKKNRLQPQETGTDE